jgi:hypothetical protein
MCRAISTECPGALGKHIGPNVAGGSLSFASSPAADVDLDHESQMRSAAHSM